MGENEGFSVKMDTSGGQYVTKKPTIYGIDGTSYFSSTRRIICIRTYDYWHDLERWQG